MKILEIIDIKNNSDIIFAKNTLRNLLKRLDSKYDSFLIFSLMELSTNLIKHANSGKIYLLQSASEIMLCALDYGVGIKNIEWSMQSGTTQMDNSLGMGLHQMNSDNHYNIEVISFTQESLHGTIVLVKPRNFNPNILSLQLLYPTEKLCGDLFTKKGRFLLLADASGHGRKAHKSAEYIKEYFLQNSFSCLLIDEFFAKLHEELKQKKLRGAVLSLFEISKSSIRICGVGNISLWQKKDGNYKYSSQKDGIIGEYFSSAQTKEFKLNEMDSIIASTDGIDTRMMNKILSKIPKNTSPAMIALCSMHFASIKYDDKTILIIKGIKDEPRF